MSSFPTISGSLSTTPSRLVDWPVIMSLIFKTDIIRRQDGSEKRYSPLNYPDQRFDLNNTFIEHDAQIKSFDFDYLSLTGESEIVDWTTLREVTTAVYSVPFTRYTMDNTQSFAIGQNVALITNFDTFDARVNRGKVIAKTATTIDVENVFFAQFDRVTRIASIAKCYSNQSERNQLTGRLDQAKISWVVKPGPRRLVSGSIDTSYDYYVYTIPYFYSGGVGYPIFDFSPDWNKQPSVNTTIINRIYGVNQFGFDNSEDSPFDLWTCSYIGSRDYLRKIEYFIRTMRGRYLPFWFIPPIEQVRVTSVSNSVQAKLYTAFTMIGLVVTFTDLTIKLAIGQKLINEHGKTFTITAISGSGFVVTLSPDFTGFIATSTTFQVYESTITLAQNYSYNSTYLNNKYIGIYDGNIVHIREIKTVVNNILTIYGWCPTTINAIAPATLYRFSVDEFNFNYRTHTYGDITLQFHQLPAYNAEILVDNNCTEINGSTIVPLTGTTHVGGGSSFNCGAECNTTDDCHGPFDNTFPICNVTVDGILYTCPSVSGITGDALCACYQEEIGTCYVRSSPPDCVASGTVSICQQWWCCYTTIKSVLVMSCPINQSQCVSDLHCWFNCPY